MNNKINITIDGPAGAGKSTVAKIVADRLNYMYLDTGAMYRTLTFLAITQNIDLTDEQTLEQLAKSLEFTFAWTEEGQRVICNGQDLTEDIRTPVVSNNVSKVAKYAGVREQLVILQRKIANNKGIVLDGRDTGTWVLPNADCKFFLTATVEKRAERRTKELAAKGYSVDFHQIKEEIEQRDREDTEREIAPLRKAQDAILIDSSNSTILEVVDEIIQVVNS